MVENQNNNVISGLNRMLALYEKRIESLKEFQKNCTNNEKKDTARIKAESLEMVVADLKKVLAMTI